MASDHNQVLFGPYAIRMAQAATSAERKAIVAEMRRMFAFSASKAYKVLAECGWESGRCTRKDAGTTVVDPEALLAIAAMSMHGFRKNGKETMPINVATSVAAINGKELGVGNSRIRQLLREKELSAKSVKKSSPHSRLRSLHPNHVHFVDPSLSLLYFTPNKQHILRDDEAYKNKPILEGKENLRCWRYVLTDHYSASICVRYYESPGEKPENLYDFLLYAWKQKQIPSYVFHGLPALLGWDRGSANRSKPVTNALKALRVQTQAHAVGKPRAKGQVENANNIVETHFECLLKLEEVRSLAELNDAAERWCAAYNANEIPALDTRLRRAGRIIGVRTMLWQRIKADQLRELPDAEVCRQIFTTGVVLRKVAGDLTIRVVHPKTKCALVYSLADLPGIVSGQEVMIQPVLVDIEPLLIVWYRNNNEEVSFEVQPIEFDAAGFDVHAAVIGAEYKAQKDTLREKNVKTLAKISGEGEKGVKPFAVITDGQGFKTHSRIHPAGNQFIRQRTGASIEIASTDSLLPDGDGAQAAETVYTHEIIISAVEAAKRIKAACGAVPEGFIGEMKRQYPEGLPTRVVDDMIAARRSEHEMYKEGA
ncbi:MAG: transposase [Spirochaetota bacterium]|jgi:transposase InsO family protein|nr:transposase [Spirochaetota bacterium]